MLSYIHLENFLFIKDQENEFSHGLNVITGDSGSGKSLLLSSISFLLGEASSYPENTAVEAGFLINDEEVFVRREIKNGKSRYFLDGRRTSLSTIRELLGNFILFQGQDDRMKILRSDFQRDVFDKFASALDIRKEYEKLYDKLENLNKQLADYHKRHLETQVRKTLLTQELQEIESIGLNLEEYESLKERLKVLGEYEKFNQHLNMAINLLDGDNGLIKGVLELRKVLSNLSNIREDFKPLLEKLQNTKEFLAELNLTFRRSLVDMSPEELDKLNTLLFEIQKLERKYGKGYKDLLKYAESLRYELSQIESSSISIEEIQSSISHTQSKLEILAKELSKKRQEAINSFQKQVETTLRKLGIEKAVFKVELLDCDGRFGKECPKFFFSSFGWGEKPLDEVASGGEISRIALALFLLLPPFGLYVMDEIDTGLSGKSAVELAKLLKLLSKHMQIILVTHSPVLASAGDKHFMTLKQENSIKILELDFQGRLKEIARLMGMLTPKTLESAKELLLEFNCV